MIIITNTLTGKKEPFKSIEPKKIRMYVCGITPYDDAHIGHGRAYVIFDLLYRLLLFLGYDVTYCRNFTDIDDKLLKRAEQELSDIHQYLQIADKFIKHYHQDMAALNCMAPKCEPRVTDNIQDIITFIQGLIDVDKAYVSNGDVYFSIDSFPAYGKLSKQKLKDLQVGARVQVSDLKRNPLDFVLWKSEPEGIFWKSPWGYGRPGWHIECSTLAQKYLGKQIDIHGGGMDLIFPHHENEIAQSEGLTGIPFANYWIHNAFVRIDKEKMSKSLGNYFTLRQVFKQFDPMVVRFLILNHHYKAPLDFSIEDMKVMEKTYQKLCLFFDTFTCAKKYTSQEIMEFPVIKKMLGFLTDDLNTPGMFGVIFENMNDLEKNKDEFCAVKQFIQEVLGLTLKPLPEKKIKITPEIKQLLDEREKARKAKDFKRADEIRKQLQQLGIEIHDKKMK